MRFVVTLAALCSLACGGLLACGDDGSSGGGGAAATGGPGATVSSSSGGGDDVASTSSGSAGGSSAGGAGQGGAGGAPIEPDACEGVEPTCPGAAPTQSGQGLVPLDRCAFSMTRAASFDTYGPLVDALEGITTPVGLATVVGDLNRTPVVVSTTAVPGDPPGVDFAFRWEDEENDKLTWVPQGLSGSADASDTGLVETRRLVLVSFYFDEDAAPAADPKGVRLALVDVTDPAAPSYRFLLLVEPMAGPDFAPIPIHAGGIAWVGPYLYVADTFAGFRVFDMRRILQVSTTVDTIGCTGGTCQGGLYKYVVPQVGAYQRSTPCTPAPRYSFVALDRSASPPQLVSGEYCSGTSCAGPLAGRVFRWAVNPATGALAGGARTYATDAHYMGETQVQGAVSHGDAFLLSSSEPAAGAGALYRVTVNGSQTFDWIDAPEDVMIDVDAGQIFSLSEGVGERFVFAADLGAYD